MPEQVFSTIRPDFTQLFRELTNLGRGDQELLLLLGIRSWKTVLNIGRPPKTPSRPANRPSSGPPVGNSPVNSSVCGRCRLGWPLSLHYFKR